MILINEWGSNTHYDYGFRIYNPAIAKFLSVDPLTTKFPFYTPYQFAGNTPIWAFDMDGLEPVFTTSEDGLVTITGYKVMAGQGPTQIAEDLNNNYSGYLTEKVDWWDITYGNQSKFQNVIHGDGQVFDKHNPDYKSGNIKTGDYLNINGSNPIPVTTPEPEVISDGPSIGSRIWNSPTARTIVPDILTIGVSYDGTFGTGGGGGLQVNLITRGPEAFSWPIFTASANAGVGFNVDATFDFGGYNLVGDVSLINRGLLETNFNEDRGVSFYISGGLSEGAKGGFTISGEKVEGGFLIGRFGNFGGGLPAGPAPFNFSTGVSNSKILNGNSSDGESN